MGVGVKEESMDRVKRMVYVVVLAVGFLLAAAVQASAGLPTPKRW